MATQSEAPQAAAQMREACTAFLGSLSEDQKVKATYKYEDGERVFWYYPPLNRHGLPLRDMDAKQRELAYNVMASGLTEKSYEQAKLIIDHELVLGPLEKEQGQGHLCPGPRTLLFYCFRGAGWHRPLELAGGGTPCIFALQHLG